MIIKSDFKDYYDCMMAYTDDRKTILLRMASEPVEINGKNLPGWGNRYDWREAQSIVVGFAGKCYPFIHYPVRNLCNFDSTTFKPSMNRKYQSVVRWWEYYLDEHKSAQLFDLYGPIWLIHHGSMPEHGATKNRDMVWVQKNCCLQDFGFHKFYPPYLAYNDLCRFVYNTAQPPKVIPEPDDETKAEIAGFNRKTSFRKRKQ